MAYYIHRLRCWFALMSTAWARAGAETNHAEWKLNRDLATRRRARAEELREQLIAMRKVRGRDADMAQ